MKFGLFGGASAATANAVSDSMQGLEEFIGYVCDADRLGYHGIFLVEHHFMGTGQVSSAMSLLAYLAAKTERIRLGTGVVVLPWHNPVLLAEQIATIDQLSRGRVDFGVGRGYRPNEFACFRMNPQEAAERYEEMIGFLRRAWSGEGRFDHRGKYWSFDNVAIDPPAWQKPAPPCGSELPVTLPLPVPGMKASICCWIRSARPISLRIGSRPIVKRWNCAAANFGPVRSALPVPCIWRPTTQNGAPLMNCGRSC